MASLSENLASHPLGVNQRHHAELVLENDRSLFVLHVYHPYGGACKLQVQAQVQQRTTGRACNARTMVQGYAEI